jgi:hypothetical protein
MARGYIDIMAYFTNSLSPETYAGFDRSDTTVSGFRIRQRKAAGRVKEGDKPVCYLTKVSRWVGLFEVLVRAVEAVGIEPVRPDHGCSVVCQRKVYIRYVLRNWG